MNSTKQKIIVALGVVIIIILVVLISLNERQKLRKATNELNPLVVPSGLQNKTNRGVGEVAPSLSVTPQAPVSSDTLAVAKPVATGSSLVTPSNIVVTPQGAPVKLNVVPASSDAPTESVPLEASQIKTTANTVKMSVSSAGFVPSTFTVKAGQLVNFVLTSTDNYTHIFTFKDSSLVGATLGVAAHETREKSWNAPQAGTYSFECGVPGHAARGETGTMVVTP